MVFFLCLIYLRFLFCGGFLCVFLYAFYIVYVSMCMLLPVLKLVLGFTPLFWKVKDESICYRGVVVLWCVCGVCMLVANLNVACGACAAYVLMAVAKPLCFGGGCYRLKYVKYRMAKCHML